MIPVGDPVRRARFLTGAMPRQGPVLYWMSRDQRVEDNWALLYAQAQALARNVPLLTVFSADPDFSGPTMRAWDFLLRGLPEVEAALRRRNIPFFLLMGNPGPTLIQFVGKYKIGMIVTDFSPLRRKRQWLFELGEAAPAPIVEVDAHNIVPAWIVSGKQEYAARTIRPKLTRLLPDFLDEFPHLATMPRTTIPPAPVDWSVVRTSLRVDGQVPPVSWLIPGAEAGAAVLSGFLARNLRTYAQARNDPNREGCSNLSPYLHFGHLAPQRVALAVRGAGVIQERTENFLRGDAETQSESGEIRKTDPRSGNDGPVAAFLEELIVRRELSDNFCLYNPSYDDDGGWPDWARKTHTLHQADPRAFHYHFDDFELARTHDELWNAAQRQMVSTGKMHGYLRIYWAKKILEWTESAQEAHQIALALNDKYELDGRDPNGYAGVAWCIGGVHDRPWPVRPVFGSIRYMSLGGCRSKFKVDEVIRRWPA